MFCNDPGAVAWQFESWNRTVPRIVAGGELPLWNPYQAGGVPLLGTIMPGVLSPLQWPYFASASLWWWDLLYVMRLLAAGLRAPYQLFLMLPYLLALLGLAGVAGRVRAPGDLGRS